MNMIKTTLTQCLNELPKLRAELDARLAAKGLLNKVSKLSVKVKFNDFVFHNSRF